MNTTQPSSLKVIIGLGNPGLRYYKTRHNIGFRVVDALASQYGGTWRERNNKEEATIDINQHPVRLIKPLTFMNSSGEVIPLLLKEGIKPENILVVHDELELPFGKIALKNGGSHKGHNGLRSIIAACGAEFWRLRFGISRPEQKEDVPDYVLQPFSEPEMDIEKLIQKSVETIELLFK